MPGFNIQGMNPLGIKHNTEFHRNHRWTILNLGVPGAQPEERLYAKSIQLPSLVLDEENIQSGAAVLYKIAKKAKWQDITVKFYDVYGLYEHFRKWQDRIWNPNQGIGLAANYKSLVEFALTDGMGEEKQIYTAYGAYPKSVTHGELSYDNSDIKLLTVTYSYDFAKIVTMDKDGTSTGGGANDGGSGPPSISGLSPQQFDRLSNQVVPPLPSF